MKARKIFLGVVFLLVLGLSGSSASGVEPHRQLAALVLKVRQRATQPDASFDLAQWWSDVDALAPKLALQQLLPLLKSSSSVADLAKSFAARLELSQGRREQAQQQLDALGYVTQWWVLGPLEDDARAGSSKMFFAEENAANDVGIERGFAGKQSAVHWRRFPAIATRGVVSFRDVFRPNEKSCAIAVSHVVESAGRDLRLFASAAGTLKVYWNGAVAIDDSMYRQQAFPDRFAAMVRSQVGNNRILVKVCSQSGKWELALRLTDSKGNATNISDERSLLSSAMRKEGIRVRPVATTHTYLKNRSESSTARYADRLRFLRWLHLTGGDDEYGTLSTELSDQLLDDKETSEAHLLAAHNPQQENSKKWVHLHRAVELDPNNAKAHLALAAYLLDAPAPERARAHIEKADKLGEQQAAAMLRSRLLQHFDLSRAALAATLKNSSYGQSPRGLRWIASASEDAGAADRAVTLYKDLLNMQKDSSEAVRFLARDAARRGEIEQLRELVNGLLEVEPTAPHHLFAAEALQSAGDDNNAFSHYKQALEIAPEDVSVKLRYSQSLIANKRFALAKSELQDVLKTHPQHPQARRMLKELGDQADPFERYAISDKALKAMAQQRMSQTKVLRDTHVIRIYENGLSRQFRQLVVKLEDRFGEKQWEQFPISYDPEKQQVLLKQVRLISPSGLVRNSTQRFEQSLSEPWYRIYYDTRALILVLPNPHLGDLVDIQYEISDISEYNVFANYFGSFQWLQGAFPTVQQRFVVIHPRDKKLYWHVPKLTKLQRRRTTIGANLAHMIKVGPLDALTEEKHLPGMADVTPYLHVSTYGDWQSVGRWYWGLIQDQLRLDAELKALAHKLTQGLDSPEQKVRALHYWLVNNIRYVGLEFGIHGYQPYRMTEIVSRGFGDCKDKASLLYALLKEIGIEAEIALLRTADLGQIQPHPPSLAAFNHAIVYIPALQKYIDGTAEQNGIDELPEQDQGTMVLHVSSQGAHLERTPITPPSGNHFKRVMNIEVGTRGTAKIQLDDAVHGPQAGSYRRQYAADGTRDERLQRMLNAEFPGASILKQDFHGLNTLNSDPRMEVTFTAPRFADLDGQALRISLTSAAKLLRSFVATKERKAPLRVLGPVEYEESRSFSFPKGWSIPGQLPPPLETKSPFGQAELQVRRKDGQVQINSRLVLTKRVIAVREYAAFRKWAKDVIDGFDTRIQLTRRK